MNELTLFNDLFDDLGFGGYSYPSYTSRKALLSPKVDVKEDDKQYTMEMDLPGKTEKDVNIELDKNVLTISSEMKSANEVCNKEKSEKEEKKAPKYIIRERTYSSFSRSFTLPDDVDSEKLTASVKDGILKVVMPRKEAQQPKKISITAA